RERKVDRLRQLSAAHQHLMVKAQHSAHRMRCDLLLLVATTPQQVQEQYRALERIDQVFLKTRCPVISGRCESVLSSRQLQAERVRNRRRGCHWLTCHFDLPRDASSDEPPRTKTFELVAITRARVARLIDIINVDCSRAGRLYTRIVAKSILSSGAV